MTESQTTYKVWSCPERGINNLALLDAPYPQTLGEYEVIVKVRYAALNPVDYKSCDWEGGVFGFSFPRTSGLDFSGLVIKAGEKVTLPPNAFVYGHQSLKSKYCVFGEIAVIDSRVVTPIPQELITKFGEEKVLSEFASIPCAGFTALQATYLKLKLSLEKDVHSIPNKYTRNIVVTAGAGGVGSFTLQLLREWRNNNFTEEERKSVRIFTTCSGNNFETVKALGATHPIDYNAGPVGQQIKDILKDDQVDAWIDLVGKDSAEEALKTLGFRGDLVVAVENADYKDQLFGRMLSVHNVSLGMTHILGKDKHKSDYRFYGETFVKLYSEGKLIFNNTLIGLLDIKEALIEMKKQHTKGKIVAKIQ